MSIIYKGKTVYNGIAWGGIFVYRRAEPEQSKHQAGTRDRELQRYFDAKQSSIKQLQELYHKALREVGEENASLFEVYQLMLEDAALNEGVEAAIKEGLSAEQAVEQTGQKLEKLFAALEDTYMQARAADMHDIWTRLLQNLQGNAFSLEALSEPVILVADDLTPSETISLDKKNILAFVTVGGSSSSHTAILARMMNIPALIGVPLDINQLENGTEAVVDADKGLFIIKPEAQELAEARKSMEQERDRVALLQALRGKPNVTKGGRHISICANIGAPEDVPAVLENDADGVGLFRSEFLYIGREEPPGEEEQYEAYKRTLQLMGEKKVVIRTLDIGADKKADYLRLEKEENPALGYRAIRICLREPELFKCQLRALLRASVYGNLAIMYPMITSVWEVLSIKEIVTQVKQELDAQGIAYRPVEEGIMIETPAAALISDELAELVDFFSVGTNDLTQYTLAIDRQNSNLNEFCNPHHKGVLRLIQMAAKSIHEKGKWIGICGELGADLSLTKAFLDMGIDELSVSPSMVLKIREKVRSIEE